MWTMITANTFVPVEDFIDGGWQKLNVYVKRELNHAEAKVAFKRAIHETEVSKIGEITSRLIKPFEVHWQHFMA